LLIDFDKKKEYFMKIRHEIVSFIRISVLELILIQLNANLQYFCSRKEISKPNSETNASGVILTEALQFSQEGHCV